MIQGGNGYLQVGVATTAGAMAGATYEVWVMMPGLAAAKAKRANKVTT